MKISTLGALALALTLLASAASASNFPPSPEAAVQAAERACAETGEPEAACMARRRQLAGGVLDYVATAAPRLVAICEADYRDPIKQAWCAVHGLDQLAASR